MENVPTNWCESRQKYNFGIIRAVSGPPGTFNPQKKKLFDWKFQTMSQCENLYCFEECFSGNTKNKSQKRGKRVFWVQF